MTIAYRPTDDEIAGSCYAYVLEAQRLNKRYVFVPPYGIVLHHKGERELNHCFFNAGDDVIVNCKKETSYGISLHGKSGELDIATLTTAAYQAIPRTAVTPQHLNPVISHVREKTFSLNMQGYLYDSSAYQWFLIPDILEVAPSIRTHSVRLLEYLCASVENGFITVSYTSPSEENETLNAALAKTKPYIKTKSGLSYPTRSWRK